MCQLVLVLLAVVAGYAGAATIPGCCMEKSVGGVNYTLVNTWENTTMYGCEWDCVYEQIGLDGSRVCFKEGGLPVVCYEDECVFPNSLYKGSPFNMTLGLKNHTDCQKLCKDYNKINHNNQEKCNYWDFIPPVGSPSTSQCDMYENITGIHNNTENGTFRGPINEYCPYLDIACDYCVETPENNCLNCLKFCSPDPDNKLCVDCVNSECPICLGLCGFTPFEECYFPNSQYIAEEKFRITSFMGRNFTECQQLCNQRKGLTPCKFWNHQPLVGSTSISCTLYSNITSIQSGGFTGNFTRGPINETCPAHI